MPTASLGRARFAGVVLPIRGPALTAIGHWLICPGLNRPAPTGCHPT